MDNTTKGNKDQLIMYHLNVKNEAQIPYGAMAQVDLKKIFHECLEDVGVVQA